MSCKWCCLLTTGASSGPQPTGLPTCLSRLCKLYCVQSSRYPGHRFWSTLEVFHLLWALVGCISRHLLSDSCCRNLWDFFWCIQTLCGSCISLSVWDRTSGNHNIWDQPQPRLVSVKPRREANWACLGTCSQDGCRQEFLPQWLMFNCTRTWWKSWGQNQHKKWTDWCCQCPEDWLDCSKSHGGHSRYTLFVVLLCIWTVNFVMHF